jgi:exosortase
VAREGVSLREAAEAVEIDNAQARYGWSGDLVEIRDPSSVVRQGNVLLLGSGESLFVEEACSGITSIVTLLPLAVVLARFTLDPGWRRAALVALVVPIAMLGNLVRVIATVAAAGRWGAARATEGSLHESAGIITFAGACLLLIAIGVVLGRGQPEVAPRNVA